jgi:hypothetical protein
VRPEPVTEALQSYADRGVFRGFRATPAKHGRVDYEFAWLTRKPVVAAFDARTRTLRFPAVFPRLEPHAAADVRTVLAGRRDRGQPAHKRLDGRRVRISAPLRKGDLSLAAQIRGNHHHYAVKSTLNLINEMFVMLQEHHPEYLVREFGLSTE